MIATTTRPGRHAVRGRVWPATGPQLLADAARYVTSGPCAGDMTARRALLSVLLSEDDERHIECLAAAERWFDAVYGPGAWGVLAGEDAAAALARCARDLEVAHERADGDAPVGGRAYDGRLTPAAMRALEALLPAIGGVR
jgi:hypothetical protein